MDMPKIKILVTDDHALFRDGMRALLSIQPDMAWVGEAEDGLDAMNKVISLQPDVTLMDINMPALNGLEATRRILAKIPDHHIVMVTMLDDDASVFAAMRAGARGYVLKGARHDEILQVIRAVAEGQVLFGSTMASRVLRFFQDGERHRQPVNDAFPELTEREREVLDLIARGMNNAGIAQQLVISPKTVRNHITNIFSKLQIVDRAQAIIQARKKGLGLI
jgi:DNA-binding NarL/FixJ family response regulator